MAAAFTARRLRGGRRAHDRHPRRARTRLDGFRGLAACGGFSYGDVLGAGEGWAKSILFNARAREAFAAFFARRDTFTLGVCNGCQMMSNLRELIPGAARWPRFVRNRSEQFEARLALVTIETSPSMLLRRHGRLAHPDRGRARRGPRRVPSPRQRAALEASGLVAARFVDTRGRVAERYPDNPNGSPRGITGSRRPTAASTILMPHPERVFRTVQMSWHPRTWGEDSPWMRMFRNARAFVG